MEKSTAGTHRMSFPMLSKRLSEPFLTFIMAGPMNIGMILFFLVGHAAFREVDLTLVFWTLFVPTMLLATIAVLRLQRLEAIGVRQIMAEAFIAWLIVTAISPFFMVGEDLRRSLMEGADLMQNLRLAFDLYTEPGAIFMIPLASLFLGISSVVGLVVATQFTARITAIHFDIEGHKGG